MIKSCLVVFILGIFTNFEALAVRLNGSIPPDTISEDKAIERAEKLDPLGNSKPTKTPANATFEGKTYKSIKLVGGLQLHPSCELEASRRGIKADMFQTMMNSYMRTMIDRMVKCMDVYPEMKGYVQESIAQYRRQVIRCEPPTGTKGMLKPIGGEYWAYNDQNNITISNDMLDALTTNSSNRRDKAISSVFHELLHSTHCNNRHDHNDVEKLTAAKFTEKKNCDDNVTMDRVSVVESLCMGSHLNSSKDTASVILGSRMSLCGSDRGCRDMFTTKGNNIDWVEKLFYGAPPTRDISNTDAKRLCQRIKDDGMCLYDRQFQGQTITKANPEVQRALKRMKERLDQLLPGISNKLPAEALALYPDLNKRFDSLQSSACIKTHFYVSDKDTNALRTEVKTVPRKTWTSEGKRTLAGHVRTISDDLSSFLNKFKPQEGCDKDEAELKSIMSEFAHKMSNNKSLIDLPNLVTTNSEGLYPVSPSLRNPDSDLVKFIGKDLVADYIQIMDKLHYSSPHFDCVAAGLAPFRAIEATSKQSDLSCEH